jgi:hypothetical protein
LKKKSSRSSNKNRSQSSDKRFFSPGRGKDAQAKTPAPHRAPPRLVDIPHDVLEQSQKKIKAWLQEGQSLREAQKSNPAPIEDPKNFPLDPWQQEVFELLRAGESVIVDAPTTAGKTRAVEVFFAQNIHDPKFRAAYTTPVKSLSNDKVRELRQLFGESHVGISTGDIKENLDAPIVVATLESYRNSLLGTEPDLGRTLVIFDEYHYLQDEGRGSAWEEALILTPPSCQVLLLSASVANARSFAEWISNLGKKRCSLVQTLHRPVPLTHVVYYGGNWLTAEDIPQAAYKQLNPMLTERPLPHKDLAARLPPLIDLQLTPCILYAGKRFDCENLAHDIARNLKPLAEEQAQKIGDILQKAHKEVGALSFLKPEDRRMIQTYGVAYHHSGLAPALRIAIERLVKDGLLRFCVATMGLSLGINFSVRSALIADYQRPGEGGLTPFAEGEILQMLGRAGRRGKDVIGFSLWPSLEAFTRMGQAKREDCRSRLRTDPSTILGLVGRGLSAGQIEGVYGKSFLKFQNAETDLRLIRTSDVQNKMGPNTTLPCANPVHTFADYVASIETNKKGTDEKAQQSTLQPAALPHDAPHCSSCPLQSKCHGYINYRLKGRLAAMHCHLHRVACLTYEDKLTPLGSVARYFPQSGGLLISRMILDGRIVPEKLIAAAELMAALCLPRFKEIPADAKYTFPFDRSHIEFELEELYPLKLFSEIYDQPFGKRTHYQLRDYNPDAGWIVRQWLTGMPWNELVKNGTTEYFGVGDLMGLMYRIATYLQSLAAIEKTEFRGPAMALRRELLRNPVDMTL